MCAPMCLCLYIFADMCMLCLYSVGISVCVCVYVGGGVLNTWLLVIHDSGCCSVQQCEGDSHWSLCGHTACLHRASEGHSWAENTSTSGFQILTAISTVWCHTQLQKALRDMFTRAFGEWTNYKYNFPSTVYYSI